MNKVLAGTSIMLIVAIVGCQRKATGGAASTDADKWFNKKEYLKGWQAQPHSSINKAEFARQYNANKDLWDAAFAYLKNTNLQTLAKGRHVITPDKVIATVTEDSTKNLDKTMWESHKKWVDIQYVIRGEEKIGMTPVSDLKVTRAYDANRDLANYEGEGKYHVATPDRFFIFSPGDAHRPNVTNGKNLPDKKVVIKIVAAP